MNTNCGLRRENETQINEETVGNNSMQCQIVHWWSTISFPQSHIHTHTTHTHNIFFFQMFNKLYLHFVPVSNINVTNIQLGHGLLIKKKRVYNIFIKIGNFCVSSFGSALLVFPSIIILLICNLNLVLNSFFSLPFPLSLFCYLICSVRSLSLTAFLS